jgi:hypothetical protein
MKTSKHEICPRRFRRGLPLLIAAAVSGAACAPSFAQTVIGSSGAGFQSWTAGNLNNNKAPFWDDFTKNGGGVNQSKNMGFCLTGAGDCVGIGSHASAPGAIPYWGMPYNSTADTGGAIDPKVYFHRGPDEHELRATLELQFSTKNNEINEIGWFETDASGGVAGTRHVLFRGSPTPDPVGKTVEFKPTLHFGYYFSDFSEGGCLSYTLSAFTQITIGCADHNLVVFSKNHTASHPTFWIAAEDPPGCGDGDCNLTIMQVGRDED